MDTVKTILAIFSGFLSLDMYAQSGFLDPIDLRIIKATI
jgi:hypothetical protein